MKKSSKFLPEVHQRAVRMIEEYRAEYPSLRAAVESIAPKIGSVPQTGVGTAEAKRIKDLEREVKALRRANENLKLASALFAQAEFEKSTLPSNRMRSPPSRRTMLPFVEASKDSGPLDALLGAVVRFLLWFRAYRQSVSMPPVDVRSTAAPGHRGSRRAGPGACGPG
jgi:transposase